MIELITAQPECLLLPQIAAGFVGPNCKIRRRTMAGPFSQKSLQAANRSSIGKISGEKELAAQFMGGSCDFSRIRTWPPSDKAANAAADPAGPPPKIQTMRTFNNQLLVTLS